MTALDVELVQRVIAEQFPQWEGLPVRPVDNQGWDNRTFRLGETLSVRLPSADMYADAILKECEWLPQLAPHLPLPIPTSVAQGQPGTHFSRPWSVNPWLPGTHAAATSVNQPQLARDLAEFLKALQQIDPNLAGTEPPSSRWRGGSLQQYDSQTMVALETLKHSGIDINRAAALWQQALQAPLDHPQVWFHGDIAPGNLLIEANRLSAVIDFGGLAVGDPACDLVIAWTFLEDEAREIFRSAMQASQSLWLRGQGWALWKALIVEAQLIETNAIEVAVAPKVLQRLLES